MQSGLQPWTRTIIACAGRPVTSQVILVNSLI